MPKDRRGEGPAAQRVCWAALALAALLVCGPAALAGADGAGSGTEPPSRPLSDDDACRERTVDEIQARYERVRDFRARFEQTLRPARIGAAAAEPVRSSGQVVVAKPARMRWSYETPEPSLLVSDGTTLWIYDPGFGEVQRLPVAAGVLSGAAIQFLLGEGDMRREFEVGLIECGPERVTLELAPRKAASYEKLRVVARPGDGELLRTEVHDLLGNVTQVEFREVEFDRDPAAETFRFDPPEGVRVIDLTVPDAFERP